MAGRVKDAVGRRFAHFRPRIPQPGQSWIYRPQNLRLPAETYPPADRWLVRLVGWIMVLGALGFDIATICLRHKEQTAP